MTKVTRHIFLQHSMVGMSMVRFMTIFLLMVAATGSHTVPVEYVVMDLRNNPDLRDQWNTDAQQVLFAHVDGQPERKASTEY